jgi:peptidyl-tRNA hydrolase, PTH2 family
MKQVLVVNRALKLPRGKLAAQVAHASVASFLEATHAAQQAWLEEGMTKIVLQTETAEDLISLFARAKSRRLPTQLIQDAGRTVLPEGTVTCLGIGPAPDLDIDNLTADLRLLG